MNGVLIMRERERERVRGSESEWTTVIRGRGRQREGERKREDPKTNYAYNKPGQSQRYYHENWRDKDAITTFYFTRFPEHTTKKDLWAHD